MLLVSKVLFGSVAVATLSGSVIFSDGVDAVRQYVALNTPAPAHASKADGAAPVEPLRAPSCEHSCDVWALLSQIR